MKQTKKKMMITMTMTMTTMMEDKSSILMTEMASKTLSKVQVQQMELLAIPFLIADQIHVAQSTISAWLLMMNFKREQVEVYSKEKECAWSMPQLLQPLLWLFSQFQP